MLFRSEAEGRQKMEGEEEQEEEDRKKEDLPSQPAAGDCLAVLPSSKLGLHSSSITPDILLKLRRHPGGPCQGRRQAPGHPCHGPGRDFEILCIVFDTVAFLLLFSIIYHC